MDEQQQAQAPAALTQRMGAALIAAQSMDVAIRAIIDPLADCDGKAFGIMCAIAACLDKMAREVDPAIEEYQAAQQRAEAAHV